MAKHHRQYGRDPYLPYPVLVSIVESCFVNMSVIFQESMVRVVYIFLVANAFRNACQGSIFLNGLK